VIAQILTEGRAQSGNIEFTQGSGFATGALQGRNKDDKNAIIMQDIAQINVTGALREHMAVNVIKQGKHAGELLNQKAMLIEDALR